MNRAPTPIEAYALKFDAELLEEPCGICEQPAGQPCVSIADGKPTRTHHTRGSRAARRRAVQTAVRRASA